MFKIWVVGLCVTVTAMAAVAASKPGGIPSQRVRTAPERGAALSQLRSEMRVIESNRIDAARERAKRERIEAIRRKVSPEGLSWPRVDRITSYWGQRRRGFHHGTDIACSKGGWDPIYAAADGRVMVAGTLPVYGRAIILQNSPTMRTLYGHMWSLKVKAGDWVRRGQIIGACGSTGLSTGPHLHFEVYRDGKAVDPLPRLPAWT